VLRLGQVEADGLEDRRRRQLALDQRLEKGQPVVGEQHLARHDIEHRGAIVHGKNS